jgi:acyl-CoA thioester hydrolase
MPAPEVEAHRRHRVQEYVRWSDVDASGLICWSAYARFVEIGETELFRAAGFPYASLWQQLDIWLPRVRSQFDYRSPARLDDLLEIETWVGHIGRSSIRLEFLIRKSAADIVAEAHLVMVALSRVDAKTVAVPPSLLAALQPYRADASV